MQPTPRKALKPIHQSFRPRIPSLSLNLLACNCQRCPETRYTPARRPILFLLFAQLAVAADPPPCEGPALVLAQAQERLNEARFDQARNLLASAEGAFGCGEVADPALLAHQWLIEGALEYYDTRDADAASEAFAAARRVAPDVWIPDLGAEVRAHWESVTQPEESGTLSVQGAPEGAVVALNGTVVTLPATAAAGLHLVQVGIDEQDIRYARIVYVPPSQSVSLGVSGADWTIAAPQAPLVEVPEATVEPTQQEPGGFGVHAALGAGVMLGQAISLESSTGEILTEPATKVVTPLELGATVRTDTLWIRAAAGASVLLGGQFVFLGNDGPEGWPAMVQAHAGGGSYLGNTELGGLLGIALPGRLSARGTVSAPWTGTPVYIEVRAGANLTTTQKVEPGVELLLTVRP